MMIVYLFWRIINSATAFLYPTYASYKALCKRPADEQELERWLMYWSVMGVIISVEYTAEWLVNWIPLYSFVKSMFLFYLALPAGHGAAAIYTNYLAPLLSAHEDELDALFDTVRARVWEFVNDKVRAILASVGIQWNDGQPVQQAPTAPPASGARGMMQGLWSAYGPGIVAGAGALLRSAQTQAQSQSQSLRTPRESEHAPPPSSRGPGTASTSASYEPVPVSIQPGVRSASGTSGASAFADRDSESVLRRRRELEAELATLGKGTPGGDSAFSSRSASSSSFVRPNVPAQGTGLLPRGPPSPARSTSSRSSAGDMTRFEEVSYDLSGDESFAGFASPVRSNARPEAGDRRSSWFGWGGGGSGGAYQKVHQKDE